MATTRSGPDLRTHRRFSGAVFDESRANFFAELGALPHLAFEVNQAVRCIRQAKHSPRGFGREDTQ
jgi:hypothetical protein